MPGGSPGVAGNPLSLPLGSGMPPPHPLPPTPPKSTSCYAPITAKCAGAPETPPPPLPPPSDVWTCTETAPQLKTDPSSLSHTPLSAFFVDVVVVVVVILRFKGSSTTLLFILRAKECKNDLNTKGSLQELESFYFILF